MLIALSTYRELRRHLSLRKLEPRVMETVQQIALVDDDMLDALDLDTGTAALAALTGVVTDGGVGTVAQRTLREMQERVRIGKIK